MFHSAFPAGISNRRLWRTFLCVAAAMLVLSSVHAENITVCNKGCDYLNVTAGISAAEPGDTLEVHSGTYHENINVTKPIILLGIDTGKGRPVVDASRKGSAMILSADGIVVDGFELRYAVGNPFIEWAGIRIASSYNVISNNLAIENDNGIYLAGFANNTISSNNATRNTNGIRLDGSNSNNLSDNYIESNNYGLTLESSANNNLDGNRATNNDYGLLLDLSEGNTLKDNLMYGNSYNFGADDINNVSPSNLVDNKPIYFLIRASGKIIDSSSRAGTVYCIDCTNMTIKDLTMENSQNGIFLSNTTHSELANNRIINNSYGIKLISSPKNIIRNNELKNNLLDGLFLDSSDNNIIENNRALQNHDYGLRILYSAGNSVIANDISTNDNGLVIIDSSNNLIRNNKLNNNLFDGLSLDSSDNNIIENNKALQNHDYGLRILYSAGNSVIANDISTNDNGLSINYSSDNLILSDSISSNENNGLLLYHSFENDIGSNDIFGNIYGIILKFSQNNTIVKNKISENSKGISYSMGYANLISNNTMLRNDENQVGIPEPPERAPVRAPPVSRKHSDKSKTDNDKSKKA